MALQGCSAARRPTRPQNASCGGNPSSNGDTSNSQNTALWLDPDLPDARDRLYAAPMAVMAALPPKADLRPQCPPIYDQGQLGSCTANAIGAAIQFDRMKQQLSPNFIPSRLFIYYNERVIEGTVSTDSGAQIRNSIKTWRSKAPVPSRIGPTISPNSRCAAAGRLRSARGPRGQLQPAGTKRDLAQRLPRFGLPLRIRLHRV